MSWDVRKPVFGVTDQVRHKPGCAAQLICVFIFTYANNRFSHDAAHMLWVLTSSA